MAGHILQQKDINNAEESFKKAINLKNDLVDAYIDLAGIYLQKGAFEDAVKQYNEIIKVNPKLISPICYWCFIYEKQGKIKEAKDNYKKALEINPKFAPAANNLAWIYAENEGNIDAALPLAETAKEALLMTLLSLIHWDGYITRNRHTLWRYLF